MHDTQLTAGHRSLPAQVFYHCESHSASLHTNRGTGCSIVVVQLCVYDMMDDQLVSVLCSCPVLQTRPEALDRSKVPETETVCITQKWYQIESAGAVSQAVLLRLCHTQLQPAVVASPAAHCPCHYPAQLLRGNCSTTLFRSNSSNRCA